MSDKPLDSISDLLGVSNLRKKILLGFLGFVLFGLVLSPFVLFDTVDETEYGLKYSTWTNKLLSEDVFEAGRYYTGPVGKFLTFPRTQISVEFTTVNGDAITGRTMDGLAITLDVSFQYVLTKSELVKLYRDFGQSYEEVFTRIARDSIRDSASFYTALQFFNNRTAIGSFMQDGMDQMFTMQYHAVIPALQLRKIDLPDQFENALERVEVARQEIEIARLEQSAALIRAQTAILEADAQRNITLIEANATAQAFIINMSAQAEALNITLAQQSESYYALAQALNLTSTELLSFLWIQALMNIGEFGNLVIIGDNTPVILNPTTNATLFS